jgi:hypothetical protein
MANAQEIAILQAAIMTLLNLPAVGQLLNLNSNTCKRQTSPRFPRHIWGVKRIFSMIPSRRTQWCIRGLSPRI